MMRRILQTPFERRLNRHFKIGLLLDANQYAHAGLHLLVM